MDVSGCGSLPQVARPNQSTPLSLLGGGGFVEGRQPSCKLREFRRILSLDRLHWSITKFALSQLKCYLCKFTNISSRFRTRRGRLRPAGQLPRQGLRRAAGWRRPRVHSSSPLRRRQRARKRLQTGRRIVQSARDQADHLRPRLSGGDMQIFGYKLVKFRSGTWSRRPSICCSRGSSSRWTAISSAVALRGS